MKLSENFYLNEFDSRDGSPMPCEVKINLKELALNLQVFRDAINVNIPKNQQIPVVVISGYRSPKYNATVEGAATNSKHMTGEAGDIRVPGWTPKKVAAKIESLIKAGKMKQGGLSAYKTFTHYDIRGYKARW